MPDVADLTIIESIPTARERVMTLRRGGATVALVPTMGALHAGHLSLVRRGREICDRVVASVFVNPMQFGAGEDLDRYPRTLDDDCQALAELGVDFVFVPTTDQMYPHDGAASVQPPSLAKSLEGVFRPTHFSGVATVVMKLFQILPATHAIFGRKDYQQLRVVESMVGDLNVPIDIVGCETVREADGLAMSSRNRYLSSSQRERALAISRALDDAAERVAAGCVDVGVLERALGDHLSPLDRVDYAVVVDADSLQPLSELDRDAVALIAGHVGSTRLIDNRILRPTNASFSLEPRT